MTTRGTPEGLLGDFSSGDERLSAIVKREKLYDSLYDGGMSEPEVPRTVEEVGVVLQEALAPEAKEGWSLRGRATENIGKIVVGGTVAVAAAVATGKTWKAIKHSH